MPPILRSRTLPAVAALVLIPLALAQNSCALLSAVLQKPQVTFKDVKLTSLSFEGISADFTFAVQNPNPVPLNLARLSYQVTIDGHALALGSANRPLAVPANGAGEMTLPVGIKFAEFVQAIESLFTKSKLPYTLATTLGFASPLGDNGAFGALGGAAGGLPAIIDVPLSTSGEFPVPKLPDVSFAGVTVGTPDITGITINLGINVVNPNQFAIPLGSLAYKVSVGGSPVIESIAPPQELTAGARRSIPIAARVDFLKTGMGIFNMVKSGNAKIAFDGALDLGFFKKPVHLEQALR